MIRSSTAREVQRLIAQLRDGSPVQREAAIARLRIIGPRAVEKLGDLLQSDAPAGAHAAALKALEGIDDHRARDLAVESLDARTPAVALAAIAALRPQLASDAAALDAIVAIALDKNRHDSVRMAALDALSDLPRATIHPVLQHVGSDPVLGARVEGEPQAPLDDPASIREWVALRGATAPLSEIHQAIVRLREREREDASPRRKQEWQAARAAAHLVLAKRDSRVALYDLRETFDEGRSPLPLDLVSAIALIGDASCLEPLGRAWGAAATEPWWRQHVAEVARTIARRGRLTARHAVVKRLRERYPGFL